MCHLSLQKDLKELTDAFLAVKMARTLHGLVIYSYLKDGTFTAVKRDAAFFTKYVKRVPLVNKR